MLPCRCCWTARRNSRREPPPRACLSGLGSANALTTFPPGYQEAKCSAPPLLELTILRVDRFQFPLTPFMPCLAVRAGYYVLPTAENNVYYGVVSVGTRVWVCLPLRPAMSHG